jgi:hypothetical protein
MVSINLCPESTPFGHAQLYNIFDIIDHCAIPIVYGLLYKKLNIKAVEICLLKYFHFIKVIKKTMLELNRRKGSYSKQYTYIFLEIYYTILLLYLDSKNNFILIFMMSHIYISSIITKLQVIKPCGNFVKK